MPVRCRSRASICAMYCLPFWLRSRSSSRSALKPARIVPPSARLSGGSSAMASRIRLATSGSSSRRSCSERSRAACCVSKQRFNAGIFSSERPSASTSRGPAVPRVTLASRRSRSRMPASSLRSSARRMVCCSSSPTASRRCSISARSMEGRSRRWRSRRPPMPVRVWSSTSNTVACVLRAGVGGEERLDQFQIAHRDGVEHHGIGAIVVRPGGRDGRARRAAFRAGNAGWRPPRPPPPAGWPGRSHRARAA